MAAWSGLSPDQVAVLDEDVYGAFTHAVAERHKAERWTNTHELLATCVEALWAIRARLQAGVPMVAVTAFGSVEQQHYPRPSGIPQPGRDDIQIVTPRELAGRAMRGR